MRLPFLVACAASLAAGLSTPSLAEPSEAADAYLSEAIAILRAKHINSLRADWDKLEAQARAQIADAATSADTHPAIAQLVDALGEKHSYLLTRAMLGQERAANAGGDGQPADPPLPTSRVLDGGVMLIVCEPSVLLHHPTEPLAHEGFGKAGLPENEQTSVQLHRLHRILIGAHRVGELALRPDTLREAGEMKPGYASPCVLTEAEQHVERPIEDAQVAVHP